MISKPAKIYRWPEYKVNSIKDLCYSSGLINCSFGKEKGGEEKELCLDVYLPDRDEKETAKIPIMILIHGGGFACGSKEVMEPFATEFASRGYAAIAVGYRLTPEEPFVSEKWRKFVLDAAGGDEEGVIQGVATVTQLWSAWAAARDCKAALRFIFSVAGDHNLDLDNVSIHGGSAGGLVGVALAGADMGSAFDPVTCQKSCKLDQTYKIHRLLLFCSGTMLSQFAAKYTKTNTLEGIPPALFICGTKDDTFPPEMAEAAKKLWADAKTPFKYVEYDGGHCQAFGERGNGELTACIEFLEKNGNIQLQENDPPPPTSPKKSCVIV
ncbi:hypothetical protein AAMO2058_001025900 [Amorphochlora amoebiformis]